MAPLGNLLFVKLHVVAQIVEAKLIVGAISDIGGISLFALFIGQAVQNYAHAQAEKFINSSHPLRIAAGKVVVDRNYMHAFAGKRIQHHRQSGHQSFTFPGFHFGNFSRMQNSAANQLHIEVAHSQGAHRSLAHQSKHLRHQRVQAFSLCRLFLQLQNSGRKRLIGHGPHSRFKRVCLLHNRFQGLNVSFIGRAKNFFEQKSNHIISRAAIKKQRGRIRTKEPVRSAQSIR